MVLSIPATTKQALESGGSQPVWLVKMTLGSFAYLLIRDYSLGAGDTFTLQIVYGITTSAVTYTEGVDFVAAGSNSATAMSMAAAINSDNTRNNRVSAYAFQDMLVIVGIAYSTRVQASTFVDIISFTSTGVSGAWSVTVAPVDRTYYFTSAPHAGPGPHCIPEIREVNSVSASIEPMTREFSIGDIEIVFDDQNNNSVARSLFTRIFPKGRIIDVSIGTSSINTADFVPVGSYLIDELIPSRGTITVTCSEITSVLEGAKLFNTDFPIPRIRLLTTVGVAGSGATVRIEFSWGGGTYSRDFVEGVDFTGVSGPADTNQTLANLANAINADTNANGRIVAAFDGFLNVDNARLYIIGGSVSGATPESFNDRAYDIKASIVSGTVLAVFPSGKLNTGEALEPPKSGWVSIHPIQALRDLYARAGLRKSTRIQESSFLLSSYPSIQHWRFSAHDHHADPNIASEDIPSTLDNAPSDIMSVDIKDRLCRMLQGSVVATEEGKIKFIRRDPTVTPVRTLTVNDYDEIEWLEQYKTACNRVTIYGTAFGSGPDERVQLIHSEESFSLAVHSLDAAANPEEMIIEESFLGPFVTAPLVSINSIVNPMSVAVNDLWLAGFSGISPARSNSATLAVNQDPLPGTRDTWVIIWRPVEGDYEYCRINSITPYGFTNFALNPNYSTTDYVYDETITFPYISQYYIHTIWTDWTLNLERGQLGTSDAINWTINAVNGNPIYMADVTIAKAMADHFLEFAYGVPVCAFRTTFRHCDLQLGDAIYADFPEYLNFLADGDDGTSKWEIIGKEIDFPWIRFTVARLSWSYQPPVEQTVFYYPPGEVVVSSSVTFVTDNAFVNVTDNSFDPVTI